MCNSTLEQEARDFSREWFTEIRKLSEEQIQATVEYKNRINDLRKRYDALNDTEKDISISKLLRGVETKYGLLNRPSTKQLKLNKKKKK